jgi:hypothetical protein
MLPLRRDGRRPYARRARNSGDRDQEVPCDLTNTIERIRVTDDGRETPED